MINWIANGFFLVMSAQNTYIFNDVVIPEIIC